MQSLEDVITLAKRLILKGGGLEPTLLIEGTRGAETVPLPDAPETIKLPLLEAVGFTFARDDRIGLPVQLFLIAEGWRSSTPYVPGLAPTQPMHDPARIEVLMIYRQRLPDGSKQMVLYDIVRDRGGELRELRAVTTPDDRPALVASPSMEALTRGFERGRAARAAP
jgi:hypothetical protein